ncbi:MAG: ABC transporter permease [Leptospirales bacterium]
MKESFEKLRNTLLADYKKLTMQKYIMTFLILFVVFGAVFSVAVMILDYKYDFVTDPSSTFSSIHFFILQFCLMISIIFACSVSICREFENNVIKNIILTGISATHYLFSRLLLFIVIFSAIALVVYVVDAILFLIYFQGEFSLSGLAGQYGITLLYLLNTLFLVVTFCAFFRVTIFPVLFMLIYYFFLEYFLIGIIKSFGPSLPNLEFLVTIVKHSPLQIIENIENAFDAGQVFINLLYFSIYLALYSFLIQLATKNTQIGLLNKK